MSLYPAPKIIDAPVWTSMPDGFRVVNTSPEWSAANKPGRQIDSFLERPSFDVDGNLWVTDIPYGRIFRISPAGEWALVTQYDGWPNGLKIHRDGSIFLADYKNGILRLDPQNGQEDTLYVAMTRGNSVWRLPLMAEGTVSKVGVFLQLSGGLSGPDGMALDQSGGLWVAHAGNGCVWGFTRTGEPTFRIKSATGMTTTNLAFGGLENSELFITESDTGNILRTQVGVGGQPMFSHLD